MLNTSHAITKRAVHCVCVSQCSAECGNGTQTRGVACLLRDEGRLQAVDQSKCFHLPQPISSQPCQLKLCGVQWYMTEWSKVRIHALLLPSISPSPYLNKPGHAYPMHASVIAPSKQAGQHIYFVPLAPPSVHAPAKAVTECVRCAALPTTWPLATSVTPA